MHDTKVIILVCKNLFFSARIAADLRRMGYAVEVESTSNLSDLLSKVKENSHYGPS